MQTATGRQSVGTVRSRGVYQLPIDRFAKWQPVGTASEVADLLIPHVDAGCTVFNLFLHAESRQAGLEAAAEIRAWLVASG